jgi:hypothetical protein
MGFTQQQGDIAIPHNPARSGIRDRMDAIESMKFENTF